MSVQDACDWLATQVSAVTGVDYATGIPDDAIGDNGIVFICFDASAVLSVDAYHQGRDLYTIRGVLMTPRSDLKTAMTALRGMPVSIANKVRLDPTFGGYVQTFDSITYQFAPALDWMGVAGVGYVIDITGVKLRPVLS